MASRVKQQEVQFLAKSVIDHFLEEESVYAEADFNDNERMDSIQGSL